MNRERILALKPGRKLDGAVSHLVEGFGLNVREVHTCPDCGWETDDLESSSRCQACWANGDRTTMGDLEAVYDFKPSTDIAIAFQLLEKPEIMDKYQIGVYPTSFGVWVARNFMPGKDCSVQAKTACEAICKSVLLAVVDE